MARTILLGEINLTMLRNYHWYVIPELGEDGKRHAQVYEVYVVTDEDYSHAPEGQKREKVALTATQQNTLDSLFRNHILNAASRESVDVEVSID